MQHIIDAVDRHRQLILDAERYIWKNPETGYKECKTSKYMEEKFEMKRVRSLFERAQQI